MNHTERMAAAEIQAQGVVCIKMAESGNPDFIIIPKAIVASVRFVEVKAGADIVRPHQEKVHEDLRNRGFQVDVMRIKAIGKLLQQIGVVCAVAGIGLVGLVWLGYTGVIYIMLGVGALLMVGTLGWCAYAIGATIKEDGFRGYLQKVVDGTYQRDAGGR
jgi:VRR-NUC domain